MNQLQAHHQNNTTTNYQFDSFGNPRLGNLDFEECESTNDRLQRYQSKLFDYDKCGNQSTVRDEDSAQHRQFNGFNQLTQLSHNGRYSHYDYDALGRRSRKTTEQHTVDFLWDGDQLIGEHCQGQYRWYIYAPDDFTPLALIDNGALYYYHTDHLGTPHTVTNSEGDVVWQATYNALGCAFISIDIIYNPLRFQGQYHDQESGLHYNRFRYYDPSIGQFIHQDPIGLLGGINHYRYAPNPIQWVDPLGLSCKEGKVATITEFGSIEPIKGWASKGFIKTMISDVTFGIVYGDTSSIPLLRPNPIDRADMEAYEAVAGLERYATIFTPVGATNFAKKVIPEGGKLAKSSNVASEFVDSIDESFAHVISNTELSKYATKIDSKVTIVKRNDDLLDWMQESFLDSNYRTVIVNDDITVYRVFGGNANAQGAFVTTTPTLNRIQAKIDSALLPDWKNTRLYEAKIIIPKGSKLDIGKVAPQTIEASGTILEGNADQLLMPLGWPKEWIQNIRNVKP